MLLPFLTLAFEQKDGTPDKRVQSDHGLGGDRERASELGKKGGKSSGGEEN